MKIVTIIWLLLAALVVVLSHEANYWLGYAETPAAFAMSDRFFGLMAECGLFLLFLVPALYTELKKRGRLWSFIGLLAFWPVVIATFWLIQLLGTSDGERIAQGLRDRITRDYTLDQLRGFAKDVNDTHLLKEYDLVSELDTTGFTSEQRNDLRQLEKKYAFMHWLEDDGDWHGAALTDHSQDGVIDFQWGGSVRGRWGCSISIDGSKNEPPPDLRMKTVHVSDDIYFFFRH